MNVMVVGSGAREHALCFRIAESPRAARVYCAPGNAGTSLHATNLKVDVNDAAAIVALAKEHAIDFVVVGPEAPLVAGVVDRLRDANILAFGPSEAAAELEGSKVASKEFMARHGVPTAGFAVFADADKACAYIKSAGRPLVVKADGLAAGKGVVVAKDAAEALDAVDSMMRMRAFGDAALRIVIEETLRGEEVSYHVVSDGERFVALAAAQDHKRLRDGDQGPNTGGMGAYSPPPVFTPEVEAKVIARVIEPTLRGMREEGRPFRGALFCGLMIENGEPTVLEYNVRFGDPECEVLMARFDGDVMPLLEGSARGDLSNVSIAWRSGAAMCVVLAAGGYPSSVEKDVPIHGLADVASTPDVRVFHAGTRVQRDDVVTAGGRVLGVCASGATLDAAAKAVYGAVARISFAGMQYRRDIGWRARKS
ncbi:MAG: phosphoribosylamine--glycine ligase [Sandaracinaceae bacterium]|nr:phosphoribosylamine--glycine ligase [Sandaracinaceae bacterium]